MSHRIAFVLTAKTVFAQILAILAALIKSLVKQNEVPQPIAADGRLAFTYCRIAKELNEPRTPTVA
jgi:hypothetical protein